MPVWGKVGEFILGRFQIRRVGSKVNETADLFGLDLAGVEAWIRGKAPKKRVCPIAAEAGRLYIETMTRRTAARRIDRETSGAIDFDAALEAYLDGSDPEGLLRAAGMVIECNLPMHRELAEIVCGLTGTFDILIETYSDAAHAIRRWFALMEEDGARH